MKEVIVFVILVNEMYYCNLSNVLSVIGVKNFVILGNIIFFLYVDENEVNI